MYKKLTDREHILKRPSMYIGAVDLTKSYEYILENKMEYKEVQYIPALIKIINEIIDNSVDVAIKTNFENSNEIKINMDKNKITVQDNGIGIPVTKNPEGHWIPELCWGHARAGSNFDDDDNRTQIGMNGVGSFATNCFSKKFIGETDDGKKHYKITFKNNAESFEEEINSPKQQGTKVTFYPDLERFGIDIIDDVHMNIIKQRLINLSMSFPEITFKFNNKKININSFKKYVTLFNESSEIYETDNYRFAILPNESDDFRQFSYVNGLKIPDGGTHIDIITNSVVNGLRDKLQRKFKSIKPGDIKNKLMIIAFLKNVKNTKFNSQSKEKITNSVKEINDYFGSIDFDKINNKLYKNPSVIDPITEVYKIKEELKRRQELKGLSKTTKKIKSEKYIPAIKNKKYLMLSEGDSAVGGLMPVLGRENCGFYALKGVPLNAYSAKSSDFLKNKELSELFKIIQNENYDYIGIATDADLDGIHICGLLFGFIQRYLPELKGKVGVFKTPVKAIKKNGVPVRWTYNLNEELTPKSGEEFKYYKGLGTWKEKDLKFIVQKDTMEKMLDLVEFDDDEVLDEWLGDDTEPRKKYLQANNFSIAKI